MESASFDQLVEDVQARYAERPAALARRAAWVAALGYLGILSWVVSIAALGIAAFVAALFVPGIAAVFFVVAGAIVLAVAIWQALEVLWLPGGSSTNVKVTAKQAPQVFALLERFSSELVAPRVHRVTVDADLNAGIQQRRIGGLPGMNRNYLRLGLPLLDVLTLQEFEAVLAHEFAHISAQHGRIGAWVYRTHQTWQTLLARLQDPPKSSLSRASRSFLQKFCEWYWPRFHAYFFVVSRRHEYDADRCGAKWSGAQTFSAALWKIDQAHRRLDARFWPEMNRLAATMPQPPEDITRRIHSFLASPIDDADALLWNRQALAEITGTSDTHPSLRDRASAIGASLDRYHDQRQPAPPSVSAAQLLFGLQLDGLRDQLDQAWAREVLDQWRARHGRATAMQHRMRELDVATSSPTVNVQRLWESAVATLELHGPLAAEPILERVLQERPTHAAANLMLGRHLLERGDNNGQKYLLRILDETEGDLFPDACAALARHFQTTGQESALREIQSRLSAFHRELAQGAAERSGVTASDTLVPVELDASHDQALQAVLAAETDLWRAFLVRKQLVRTTARPVFVLCVQSHRGFLGRAGAARDSALVRRLLPQVHLPGSVLVVAPHGGFRKLCKKIMATPDAQIYEAAPP